MLAILMGFCVLASVVEPKWTPLSPLFPIVARRTLSQRSAQSTTTTTTTTPTITTASTTTTDPRSNRANSNNNNNNNNNNNSNSKDNNKDNNNKDNNNKDNKNNTNTNGSCGIDIIIKWNSVMLQANAVDHALASTPPVKPTFLNIEQRGPVLSARAFAIVSAAMYDAYNSIQRIGTPILKLVDFPGVLNANVEVAVAQAAHDTLKWLYKFQYMTFAMALEETISEYKPSQKIDDAINVGKTVASSHIVARANDGWEDIQVPPYVPPAGVSYHVVDPLNPGQGVYAPNGGDMDPFVISDVIQYLPSSDRIWNRTKRAAFLQSAEYTQAFNEVKSLGALFNSTRTEEQTKIAIFWGYDGRPFLGTPSRLYNQAARAVAKQQCNTVAQNARLFALINLAMADATIACWKAKYVSAFWRPIVGIRAGSLDNNPNTEGDPDWKPLGSQVTNCYPGQKDFTPNFPSYTAGHAVMGAAVFSILRLFYDRDDIAFSFVSDEFNGNAMGSDLVFRQRWPRSFSSFTEAMHENARSRVYQGVHWKFDGTDGIETGVKVAQDVFNKAVKLN